jgi:SAM-dependent methyltransferase
MTGNRACAPAASHETGAQHTQCLVCRSDDLRRLPGFRRVSLVKCADCGLVFCIDIPTREQLVTHYDQYLRDTSYESHVSNVRREEWLDQFTKYSQTNRILDVGCGIGDLLNQARRRNWETHGVEFTDRAVEICTNNGHRMTRGPLDPSRYERDYFDVVEVLEHINNQIEEMARVGQILRPGGLLFITTPNFNSLSRRALGDHWNVIQYPEHLAYFTPATLKRLMHSGGYETAWLRTTGVSVTRWKASIANRNTPVRTANRKRAHSADEKLRTVLEKKGAKQIKRTMNWLLTLTQTGDSIKAGFVKRVR